MDRSQDSDILECFDLTTSLIENENLEVLELVMKERENDYKKSQMVIKELNQKIEGLNHELKETITIFKVQISSITESMEEKFTSFLKNKNDEFQNLKKDLQEVKEKWAATQCNLQDTEAELKEVNQLQEITLESLRKERHRLQESQKIIDDLNVKKIANEDRAIASENSLAELTEKLNNIQSNLTLNWITKLEHSFVVAKFEKDIKAKEIQIVDLLTENDDYRKAKEGVVLEPLASYSESVAQAADQSNDEVFKASLGMIAISEDRKRLLTTTGEHELISSSLDCEMCPKYQAKLIKLEKYCSDVIDKIKMQDEKKTFDTKVIQKRIKDTEIFLQSARSNLENILQNQNVNKK